MKEVKWAGPQSLLAPEKSRKIHIFAFLFNSGCGRLFKLG